MSFIVTLTITAQDRNDLSDVMQNLVGLISHNRANITITLDQVGNGSTFSTENGSMSRTEHETRERLWGAQYQAKQRKLAARAARAQTKATRNAEDRERMRHYDERARHIQAIVDAVGCTTCHVGKGMGCVSAHGTLYTTFVHAARAKAATK